MRLRYGAMANFAGNGIASVITASAMLIAIHSMTPEGWGVSAAWLGIGQVAGAALSFGTSVEKVRRFAKLDANDARKEASAFLSGRLIIGFGCAAVAAALLASSSNLGLVFATCAGVFVEQGSTSYFIACRRYLVAAAVVVADKLLLLLVVCLWTATLAVGVAMLPIAFGISGYLSGVMALVLIGGVRWEPKSVVGLVRSHWAGSKFFAVSSVAPSLLLLDIAIMKQVAGAEQAGYYASGSKFMTPLALAATAVCAVLLPSLSSGTQTLSGALRTIGARVYVACGIGFIVCLWAVPLLVPFLLGEEYFAAEWPIRIFVLNAGLVFANRTCVTALQSWGMEREGAILVFCQTVTGLVGVIVGGVAMGAIGGASGLALSNGLLLGASLIVVRRVERKRSR